MQEIISGGERNASSNSEADERNKTSKYTEQILAMITIWHYCKIEIQQIQFIFIQSDMI
jgi:hypothetical protein